MPTSGELDSLPAVALTSLKRWLLWNASRNFSLWRSARLSCTALPIMIAQEQRENTASVARMTFAIGPDWKKKSNRPGPRCGPSWKNRKEIRPMRAPYDGFRRPCHKGVSMVPPPRSEEHTSELQSLAYL